MLRILLKKIINLYTVFFDLVAVSLSAFSLIRERRSHDC
jgi:hypothetical protein